MSNQALPIRGVSTPGPAFQPFFLGFFLFIPLSVEVKRLNQIRQGMFFIPAKAADSRGYDDAHTYSLKPIRRKKNLQFV